jgi:D-inositol-3-phosphate glycosyltransferase
LQRIAVISAHTSPLAPLGYRETGGMNVYVRELSREMGRRGYQIDVFTRRAEPDGPDVVEASPNVRVVHLRAGPEDIEARRQLYAYLRDFERGLLAFQRAEGTTYDVIHSHYWLSGALGLRLRERWGAPLVNMFHTLGELKRRANGGSSEPAARIEVEGRVAKEADVIVSASEHEKRALIDLYGTPADRIAVVPCGVDLGCFRPIDKEMARRSLGVNGERVILFVGRMEPLKGLDLLLGAAARLDDEPPFQVLVVGGDGNANEELSHLKALSAELGIASRVRFSGPVGHDVLPLYYNAADVCVVPSYYESFCLVALEAMACGTPVVASRVGGLSVTVRDGETGYLVPRHSPQPFAERVATLLADEELRRTFGRSAKAKASGFGWGNVADAIERIYRGLLAGRAVGPAPERQALSACRRTPGKRGTGGRAPSQGA